MQLLQSPGIALNVSRRPYDAIHANSVHTPIYGTSYADYLLGGRYGSAERSALVWVKRRESVIGFLAPRRQGPTGDDGGICQSRTLTGSCSFCGADLWRNGAALKGGMLA